MFIKYLTIIFLIFVLNSCSTFDCTVDDNTQCSTHCEQAKRFVEKLIEHPSAWECIKENEKYIDCTTILNIVRKDKREFLYCDEIIQYFSDFKCKIMRFCYYQKSGKYYFPELQEKTVLTVELRDCEQPEYNPNNSQNIRQYDIKFIINSNKKLELLGLGLTYR